MLSKFEWIIFKLQHPIRHAIHQIFEYLGYWPSKDFENLLVTLVFFMPLLVIGSVIWLLYKWIMIRLGKDALTNYRHYQKTFSDNNTDTSHGISNNIFECPYYPDNHRKKIIHQCLAIVLTIALFIAYAIHLAPNILDLIYTIGRQLEDHLYTDKAFLKFVFQDMWEIIYPIVIPIALFIIMTIFLKAIDVLYDKVGLLLKTKTRITTEIRRAKKVRYDKSDI